MTDRPDRQLDCARVDELAGALALAALDPDEQSAVDEHLTTCPEPHDEVRALLGAPIGLASTLEPMEPHPAVRARLMRTIAAEPQSEQSVTPATTTTDRERPAWSGWRSLTLWRGLAAVAAVGVLAIGIWNVSLRAQLETRDAALAAVAEAIAGGYPAYPVSGPAGTGYVIDTAGPGSTFLVAGLESLPGSELYEMWLIDADGTPLAVGSIEESNADLVVATIEQDLAGFAVFAVTVEPEVVTAPTSDPVMAGPVTN